MQSYNASPQTGDTKEAIDPSQPIVNRRRGFLKAFGLAGAALSAGALFSSRGPAKAASRVTPGDIDILRLLAAAELIEADLWQQYAELGGAHSRPAPRGGGPDVHADEQLSGGLHEPRSRRPPICFQQCRRRAEPRHVPERVFAICGRGAGGPRRIPHLAEQPGDRRPADRPTDQLDEAQRRYQLVHPLSQRLQPRSRRQGGSGLARPVRGSVHCDPPQSGSSSPLL